MKRKIWILIGATLLLSILCACGQSESSNDVTVNEEKTTYAETFASTETTVPSMMGSYTKEEAAQNSGIYIAHEDGCFEEYPRGGYLAGTYITDGMYMSNSQVERIPKLSKENELVIFCNGYYDLDLYPVNDETSAIEFYDHGVYAFGRMYDQNENAAWVSVTYDGGAKNDWKILYINGEPASDYQAEKISNRLYSFPRDSSVTFGVAEGSKLVETKYDVTATYFDCIEGDYYNVVCSPTPEGYATVDMVEVFDKVEIPAGRYVMLLRMQDGYVLTLLDWSN